MDDAGSPAQLTKPTQSKSGAHHGRVRQCRDEPSNGQAEHREWLDGAEASGGLFWSNDVSLQTSAFRCQNHICTMKKFDSL